MSLLPGSRRQPGPLGLQDSGDIKIEDYQNAQYFGEMTVGE